jgi:hypothetical protein
LVPVFELFFSVQHISLSELAAEGGKLRNGCILKLPGELLAPHACSFVRMCVRALEQVLHPSQMSAKNERTHTPSLHTNFAIFYGICARRHRTH